MKQWKMRHITVYLVLMIVILMPFVQWLSTYNALKLNTDWHYFSNQYISPLIMDMSDRNTIDLNSIKGSVLTPDDMRIRGTLVKHVTLPGNWTDQKLVVFQRAFLENAKFFINDKLVYRQGEFTVEGLSGQLSDYEAFVTFESSDNSMNIMVYFDQSKQNSVYMNDFMIMPLKQAMLLRYLLTVMETVGVFISILLIARIIRGKSYKKDRIELLSLLVLLMLRWFTVSISPMISIFPFSVSFWLKFGLMTYIVLSFYILLMLFEKRKIWAEKTHVIMAVYTFLMVINVLILNSISLSVILYLHIAVMVFLYAVKAKSWLKATRIRDVVILNMLLIFDALYQLDIIMLPFHLLLLALYIAYWVEDFKVESKPEIVPPISNAFVMPDIMKHELSSDNAILFAEALLPVGFVNSKLTFHHSLSAHLINMFEISRSDLTYPQLLFPNDIGKRIYVEEMMHQLYLTEKISEKNVYIDLLPKSAFIKQRYYEIAYSWSESTDCLVVNFRDTTEKVGLLEQLEEVNGKLELSHLIINNQEVYITLEKNFHEFISVLKEQRDETAVSPIDNFYYILDNIKYFNAQFNRLKLSKISQALSKMENDLEIILKHHSIDAIKHVDIYFSLTALESVFEQSMTDIESLIPGWRYRERYWLMDESQIDSMITVVDKLPDSFEREALLNQIWRVKHFSLEEMIRGYDTYIQNFARIVGKKILPLEIETDRILFNRERFEYFSKACIEILSNIIRHGIERPEMRIRKGKIEYGLIKIIAGRTEKDIIIKVIDDGAGIAIENIKSDLIERYPNAYERITSLTDEEVIAVMLGRYSKDDLMIGELPNGLMRLNRQISEIGGEINIYHTHDGGTTVVFKVPNSKNYMALAE